ncbi:cytochrome P450 [Mycobacterium sp. ACS4331]|uniref:cytochrome P450 n=1 Tax=Mycobacterium sp. ACS4331 TaxID=1834121 RepID=UPI0007FF9BF9|nr:cytochrome P450 [Mycobacterium sp. ACS4331]OBF29692.1 cytochrome [Mycobacterium sp. ACS4331]
MSTQAIPTTDVDIFSDEVILDPHPTYRQLRDLGPAVWMERHTAWIAPRYAEVHSALQDWETFSSASGLALNDIMNSAQRNLLTAEPPEHATLRRVLGARLTPRALRQLEPEFQRRADALIDELVEKGTFEGVSEFSVKFPLSVVPDLLGCPPGDRSKLLDWAAGTFDAAGPLNERAQSAFAVFEDLMAYLLGMATNGGMDPDGWWSDILVQANEHDIPADKQPFLIFDFLVPSMDTTISALSTALWQLGQSPDQWQKVREDRTLIDNIADEATRFEAPARGFARLLTKDVDLGGVHLPAGDRVFLSYSSANRDERRWESPDTFDITRDTRGHIGFGSGIHRCLGMGLAKLETRTLFTALANRVESFEVGDPTWRPNNIIRNIGAMPVTIHSGR